MESLGYRPIVMTFGATGALNEVTASYGLRPYANLGGDFSGNVGIEDAVSAGIGGAVNLYQGS